MKTQPTIVRAGSACPVIAHILKILIIGGIGVQTFTLASCGKHSWEDTEEEDHSSPSVPSSKPSSSSSAKQSSSSSTPSSSSPVSGVIYGTPVTYEGEIYETVVIGTQTWMAKNLNYDVRGSVCYKNDPANCAKYGRLYNWATAMDTLSKCNTSFCSNQRQPKGICPDGWHIPSNAEWDKLMRYVDGTNGTSSPYGSPTASKYLKARSGWNDYLGKSGDGTDNYGFAALPGGEGDFDGSFNGIGNSGYWWSSSEYGTHSAYYRFMHEHGENAVWNKDDKSSLRSVRCVQDYSSFIPGEPVTYENETYQTVIIGTQTWMARNLNYDVPNNSTDVCYNNNPANCEKYGRLYNWATAMGISSSYNSSYYNTSYNIKYRGVCPSGWHIPNSDEWDKLMHYADGTNGTSSVPYNSPTAGRYLKARNGWNYNGNGTDEFGFSALPGGYGYLGNFENVGNLGGWWNSSEITREDGKEDGAVVKLIFYDYEKSEDMYGYYKSALLSIRCVKDN